MGRTRLVYWERRMSSTNNDDEVFEVFDENNSLVGTARRADVHTEGLFHRAVNVVLVDDAARVLLQKRSAAKKINGSMWDVSVGEHLNPGESYAAGAARGLWEELGIPAETAGENLVEVVPPRLVKHDYPEIGKRDYEFVALYAWRGFDPTTVDVVVDGVEVDEVAWVPISGLAEGADDRTPTLEETVPVLVEQFQ